MPNVIEPKIKEQKLFKCEREIRKNNLFFEKNSITFNFEKKFLFSYKKKFLPNVKKEKEKNQNQTNVENIIYFRLHDLSSSKWIDPPHTPLPLHTQDETMGNRRATNNRKNGQTEL